MRKLFLVAAVLSLIQLANAQDSLRYKQGTFKATVTDENLETVKGYLSSITDSTIYVSPGAVQFKGYGGNTSRVNSISYYNISEIKLRREGSTGRGILIGAASGAITGILLGFADGDDYKKNQGGWCLLCATAGEKAAAGGVVFGLAGGIVGGVVGALAHKTFVISGKKEKFDKLKWKLIH